MDSKTEGAGSQRRRKRRQVAVELMQDFAENSTLHGLKYMSERGRSLLEKIFWVATFLVSISLCAVLIRNVWRKWESSPVIVALSEQLVSVGEVPFPSVTICPQIKAKRTVYNFTHETIEMKKKLKVLRGNLSQEEMEHDPQAYKYEDVGLVCWVEYPMIEYKLRNYSDATVIQNIIEVSPNIDDIFRSCHWREKELACDEMFSPVLTNEGLCFAMNSLASSEMFKQENIQQDYYYLNSSTPSKLWTLKDGYTDSKDDVYPKRGRVSGNSAYPDVMVILAEHEIDKDGLCYGINHGYKDPNADTLLKVYLQHPADMPQSSLYYYAALPGMTSSFALKFSVTNTSESLMNYLPEIRQCYFPEEHQLKYFRSYTPKNCLLECLSEYTFESCGCVWFHMPHNDSTTICRENRRNFVINAMERYSIKESQIHSKLDRCNCLPACTGIQYDAEILKTKFDIHSYLDAIKQINPEWYNETDEDAGHSFTMIELYYKEPRYVSMRRSELFGLTDFLANCGGLLGLFLGFSFLSLVEIFYFLTLRLGCALRRDTLVRRDEIDENGIKNTNLKI